VANATVSLNFRYLKSDIVRAMRSHYASHLRPRLDIIMAVALAALGSYLWRSPSSHWFGVMSVGASAVFGLILVAAFLVIPPLAFGNDPKYRDEYSLTFSPEGIHFQTAQVDSHLEWTILFASAGRCSLLSARLGLTNVYRNSKASLPEH
jgi:hypothetical protein